VLLYLEFIVCILAENSFLFSILGWARWFLLLLFDNRGGYSGLTPFVGLNSLFGLIYGLTVPDLIIAIEYPRISVEKISTKISLDLFLLEADSTLFPRVIGNKVAKLASYKIERFSETSTILFQ